MYKEKLFHGSNKIRGNQLIDNGRMEISRGDNHWLGDGSYLFAEDFQAYKWIVDMFKARYSMESLNYNSLLSHYLILQCQVSTNKKRVFDLTKSEHKIAFDNVHKELSKKKKIPLDDVAEGVILNYMFNELGFDEEFDLVRAVFCMNKDHYRNIKTRLGFMPQEQICIKNLDVVKDIKNYNFKDRIKNFDVLMNNYYYSGTKPKKQTYDKRKNRNLTYTRRQVN